MKIAINIEALGARRGGAEKYAAALARSLIADGHEVHVVARDVDAGELPPATPVHRIELASWPLSGWLRSWRFAAASERVLRGQRFDLVIGLVKVWYQHVYIAVGGTHRGSLVANSQRFRAPWQRALWWATKIASPKQWVYRAIERRQFERHAPHVIVPAESIAADFRKYHRVPRERTTIVPWGIDTSQEPTDQSAARAAFRARHGLHDEDVALLFVARNYALKGLEPLVHAFAMTARRQPRAKLLVCGSRRDGRFRRLVQQLGLADRVAFLGFVDDIQACFAGADVFVFPTFYDPCSLVVLEALRAGLPVITTRQNGASELMSSGAEGFVLDAPWQTEVLAAQMEWLVADSALRARMGRRARQTSARFSHRDRAAELIAALVRASGDPEAQPLARKAA